jgi:prepilin signal peptidase PulO-like enzyme (type II secretory pathway)
MISTMLYQTSQDLLSTIDYAASMDTSFTLLLLMGFLGACFGSLVTLLSWRIPRHEPIGMTRSRCPSCKKPLSIPDLFPILSWLYFKGTCRQCHVRVHWRYPLTELICCSLFILIYVHSGISAETICLLALATTLLTLIVIDLEHYIIPDSLQLILAGLALIYHFGIHDTHPATMLASLIMGLGTGWLLQTGYRKLRHKEGLGTGDVKFLAVAGLWLDVPLLTSLFFYAGLLGILTSIVWRMMGKGPRFPFGPALAMSMFTLILYPDALNVLTLLQQLRQ